MISAFAPADPLYSPTWGCRIDLPGDFAYQSGDGKSRFSFRTPDGITLDMTIYPGARYPNIKALAEDVQKRLGNKGELNFFDYHGKQAALLQLSFSTPSLSSGTQRGSRANSGTQNRAIANEGWALCVELDNSGDIITAPRPLLLALSYGPAGNASFQSLYLSALDSIAPAVADTLRPGPVTEFTFPRTQTERITIANSGARAQIYNIDAEAAQALVDREFTILRRYENSPLWKEAWIRFYRAIYRDAFDRLADIAFALEREWNNAGLTQTAARSPKEPDTLPAQALAWVQSFTYERNRMGSDFVNLVSAAAEGRGDCDSRALLWAVIVQQANIPAAIMVSREYSHAMGLADIPGSGARFEMEKKKWLVAETTAPVPLGQINAQTSETSKWIGIGFN
ncbi:hypothetical protein AGMMS49991_00490 [Spirochaetia bacterium]|nr:hypothetical protein AGMMS49991_00490 [Spirochaetia bacterium]